MYKPRNEQEYGELWRAHRLKEVRKQTPYAKDFREFNQHGPQAKSLARDRRLQEVVDYVKAHGQATREELAKALPHISLSTMTAYTMDLVNAGRLVANRATPTSARKKLFTLPETDE